MMSWLAVQPTAPADPETRLSEHMGGVIAVCVGLIVVVAIASKLRKKTK